MVKVDLACGQSKQEGFVGVDIWEGADIVHNLFTFPYPFEDNSVDEIFCSHFIEHLPMDYVEHNGKNKDLLFAFMDEVHRILKPGGKAHFIFPNAKSSRAFQDPTHRRFIPEQTVAYFNKQWRELNKLDHYNVECDFTFQTGRAENASIVTRNQEYKQFATQHYWDVVDDIHWIMFKPNEKLTD